MIIKKIESIVMRENLSRVRLLHGESWVILPAEFKEMKKKDRKKEGIKLLRKAADAEADSNDYAFDIFKKSSDPDEKKLAKSYLAILVKKKILLGF